MPILDDTLGASKRGLAPMSNETNSEIDESCGRYVHVVQRSRALIQTQHREDAARRD